ncbi:TPA: hypothetical protein NH749_006392 [Pseudomonas aeruginosa]|nr:hypothetical protein [Pseudomonas aeruginosa]HCF0954579.1 hypothetical protein [Pseudomonas aeruginosa]
MIRCRNCGERPASEGHICMVCKRRSDIDPYKALIAMALLVYCGVSLAAYLKPHMPAPPPTAGSSVQPAEGPPGHPGTARHLKNACSGGEAV